MRTVLLVLSMFGALLFGTALVLSYISPLLIERAAREVVRIEVEHQVGETIDSLSQSRIVGLAERALEKTDAEIAETQQSIRADLPRKVASVIADMLNADCECRKRLVASFQTGESIRLASRMQFRDRLAGLIESAYASVSNNLIREFRIFAASNAVAFALLGAITFWRKKPMLQLVLPAVVLIGAVVVTAGMYLFNQNWLHTIMFGQYVGLGYCIYLACVALLLADVVFNRARATTRLANLLLTAVGSAATAIPC
jgi:hypothetical protein